jgi:hypothetical protein
MLLMAPSYTNPRHAHHAVMTAGRANDSSTPDQPRGDGPHRATDPSHGLIALQRLESDGGAVQ